MSASTLVPDAKIGAINKKIFTRLMPLLIAAYVVSFLDRTNIGMAKERLEIDLGITAAAYGLGAGLFFLAYTALEIPSNLIMNRVGARFWITRIMITWGVISGGMAFVNNDVSFYIMRILLGAAEAGLFPGVMLYLTYWFSQEIRAKAIGYFIIGACIANVIGGPVGGLLLQMDGVWGFHGWQWLFVVEAIPAIILSYFVWKHLPDRPRNARWLTPTEAKVIEDRLAAEQEAAASTSGTHSFAAIFRDKTVMLAIFINLAHQVSLYSVTYFLPSVIKQTSTAMPPWLIGTLAATPWFFGAVGALLITPRAKSPQGTQRLVTLGLIAMAAGTVLGVLGGPILGLAGFGLAGLFWFVVQPIMFSVPGARLTGATLAAGLGLMNTIGITGGFFGPAVMGFAESATGNSLAGLWFAIALLTLAGVASLFLRFETPTRVPISEKSEEPAAR